MVAPLTRPGQVAGLHCLRWVVALCLLLGAGATAHSDEFSRIPAGDLIYTHLKRLHQQGVAGEVSVPSTRYEAALETAKTAFAVTARMKAGDAGVSPLAVESLKALVLLLRPELKILEVDVAGMLNLLERRTPAARLLDPEPPATDDPADRWLASTHSGVPLNRLLPSGVFGPGNPLQPAASAVDLPLSQRLRVTATLLAMNGDRDDPFGEWADAGSIAPTVSATTRASWDINQWLTLYSDYEVRRHQGAGTRARTRLFSGEDYHGLGAGADIRVSRSVKVTGRISSLRPAAAIGPATRISGGLGISAWENRLRFNAHFARLLPEDAQALTTTAAELNLDVDVSQRLSVKLLYQQLFDTRSVYPGGDRMLSGGLSLSF